MSELGFPNPLQSDPIAPSDSISTFYPTQSTLPTPNDLSTLGTLPDGIPQFSTPKAGNYAIWSQINHNSFLKWWKTTLNGLKDIKPSLNWAKHGNSMIWSHIEQIAEVQTGLPKVRCIACNMLFNHPNWSNSGGSINGTSTIRRHVEKACKSRVINPSQTSIESSFAFATEIQSKQYITYQVWFKLLMNFFTTHHLPFNILNSQQFKAFIEGTAQLASVPSIPSPRTLSRRLRDESLNQQITALSTLPEAITGYFLDLDWHYREVLLGFEPLYGPHSGANLARMLTPILEKHNISDRIMAITTDNASNNKTLISSL
ncbi:uncharacterized protein N7503_001248 [Penicillium pulvis]|uniref:uncharacterized protein n=1 Tax=Penicillium pulvis TaxID=1562058 RepID=UPI002546D550|nr:uncharacterized protein N7503_001248 [Penicillium pulvis]KAJ5809030.1 hypothetical protein N7503_001248 [Penicillium pulvis]